MNMSQRLLITNCRFFDATEDKQTTSILIENGVISQIGKIEPGTACDDTLDAQGRIIAPGFIDIHIQGAGGADILDSTPEALKAISRTCARFGVTGFLATTVFKPNQENRHLALAAEYVGRDLGGANLLGIHLEGPFISRDKRGMIQPGCICSPSVRILDEIQSTTGGHLRMMTIAPELPDSRQIIRSLVESGTIASFGHSSATYEQTLDGFDAGISHVTHLFNAMASLHHREPGPLVAIFESEHITAQVITDGVHIHPAVLKLAYKKLGPVRTIPITDGMQAIGLGDGMFIYNGVEYESKAGAARYKDGTLIGTAIGLSQMLERFVGFTDCPLEVAIRMVTQNPARILGLENKKGSIAVGKDADLILLEDNLSVNTTIVAGKIVFRK
jgi:N-acetylglucosamine-6-phosphate deacetylase